jgi:hypothetical protein
MVLRIFIDSFPIFTPLLNVSWGNGIMFSVGFHFRQTRAFWTITPERVARLHDFIFYWHSDVGGGGALSILSVMIQCPNMAIRRTSSILYSGPWIENGQVDLLYYFCRMVRWDVVRCPIYWSTIWYSDQCYSSLRLLTRSQTMGILLQTSAIPLSRSQTMGILLQTSAIPLFIFSILGHKQWGYYFRPVLFLSLGHKQWWYYFRPVLFLSLGHKQWGYYFRPVLFLSLSS